LNLSIKQRIAFEYFMLIIGCALAAFSIEAFLVPNTILDGGMIGIGIMINNLSGIPLGLLTVVLNVPFIIFGSKKLGKQFVLKSIFSMIVFSVFVSIFETMEKATQETLLAVCFGGVILGLGVGIVIRFGGCLDGTEALAIIINRKFKLPVGQMVLGMNLVIYSCAGFLFGFDRAMYSLLTYFITSRILDMVETGINQAKAAMIITDDEKAVAEKIYRKLGRTVTFMQGEGMISGKKSILYCVITRFEVLELKNIINSIDSSAFVTVTDVSEIIGNHIKSNDKESNNDNK